MGTTMNRTLANLIVDSVAALLFIGMLATGWILRFPLPPGTNKALLLWGLTRHQWGGVHTWISLGLMAVLAVHIVLHWQWISSVIAKRLKAPSDTLADRRRRGVVTVVLFLLSITAFAWVTYRGVSPKVPIKETEISNDTISDRGAVAEAPSEQSGVNFWGDVYPILDRSCSSCHNKQQANAGFRVDLVADYFRAAGGPALIVRGKADDSPLIAIVSGRRQAMPLAAQHRLLEQEVTIIAQWINEGAELADELSR
jgi:uncharacterized membrane protein